MKDLLEWVGLSLASGLGPAGYWNLVNHFGTPGKVLQASSPELSRVPGVRPGQVVSLGNPAELLASAEAELSRLQTSGCRALSFPETDYPELLRQTIHPPPVLYIRGRAALLNSPAIAIVGSRAATSYGRRTTFSLAGDLADRGMTVVSGLAMGIDAEAHAGCLARGGNTIGVLGCGLDVVYPRSNRKLYEQTAGKGLLVSEYPLGTKPEGFRFPARNRIIAGLTHGVVVVEAARKSGSLITVQFALEEGREVFAVPGQIDSVKSRGTHWLLQQGASLIISAEDILQQLRLPVLGVKDASNRLDEHPRLDEDSSRLLSLIEPYPMRREDLVQCAGLSPARLSEILLVLELDGLVELLPGDELCKIVRRDDKGSG